MFQKIISKVFISFLTMFFIFQPLFALADGVMLRPLPGAFDLVEENNQQAFINHQNGTEKLIIAVDFNKESSEIVWVVPVPAKPEEVKVDIISSLPHFFGEDIIKKAKNADLASMPLLILSNQTLLIGGLLLVSFPGASGGSVNGEEDLVSVFQHLEKAGMIAEVITAKNDKALYNYLSVKGLNLAPGALPALNEYIGKEYTFVVSWLSSGALQVPSAPKEERGIFISFPSKKIYYPLLLTSVYDKNIIPITIRVVGYIKPKSYSELKPFVKINYYTEPRRYRGGATSRCISAFAQLGTVFTWYNAEKGVYPNSIVEVENIPDAQPLMEEIKKHCQSVEYKVDSSRNKYRMTTLVGTGKEWAIDSEGFSDEQEIPFPTELQNFYGSAEVWRGTTDYTKISINSPAENLKKDLWMTPGKPTKVWVAKAILCLEKNIFVSYFLFNAIFSFLIGGLLGLAFFKNFKRYAFVGLANLATVIGLAIAFYAVQRNIYKDKPKPRPNTLSFIILFSIILIILSFVLIAGLAFLL